MAVPHIAGHERDYWFKNYEWVTGPEILTGGWPKFALICTLWEENAAGERRLIEQRTEWVNFDSKVVLDDGTEVR